MWKTEDVSVGGRQTAVSLCRFPKSVAPPRYKNMIIVPGIFPGSYIGAKTPLTDSLFTMSGWPGVRPPERRYRQNNTLPSQASSPTPLSSWRGLVEASVLLPSRLRSAGCISLFRFSGWFVGPKLSFARAALTHAPFPHLQLLSHVLLSRKGSYHDMRRRDQHPLATRLLPPSLQ